MKSKVYFSKTISPEKIIELIELSGKKLPGNIAVKVHSGEVGNQNFLRPEFWKPVVDHVGGTIVECNTAYEVFYVHRPDVILPEYLALLVKQDWFTRYCEFMGSGSAREYCRVANISELEIEVPPIEFQAEMARDNQIIRDRIELKRRINDNLAA